MTFINIFNRKKNYFAFIILLLEIILFTFQDCSALNSDKTNSEGDSLNVNQNYQELDGHNFISNVNIGLPFTNTFINTRMGVGQTVNLNIPPVVINGEEVLQLRGDLIFSTINFSFQQQIKDWMAFNADISVFGRLGTKGGSLISQGVNILYGYDLGLIFKLLKYKKSMTSLALNTIYSNSTFLDLNSFINEIIDSGKITPDNKLVKEIPVVRGGGTLISSYAINKTFGATGKLQVQYGESFVRNDKDDWYFNYGVAFDADLMPSNKIPLGFILGFYSTDISPSNNFLSQNPKHAIIHINYTGRKDLNLGLEFDYQFYKPVDFESSIKFVNVLFNLKYLF